MRHQFQNDETLVMLTLAGEQSAYEVLVARYQKAVILAAASITHNQFMAEDAAQDAFVAAWMKLNTLQEPGKFAAWICKIAKNCALNMVMRYRSFLPLDAVDYLNFAVFPLRRIFFEKRPCRRGNLYRVRWNHPDLCFRLRNSGNSRWKL